MKIGELRKGMDVFVVTRNEDGLVTSIGLHKVVEKTLRAVQTVCEKSYLGVSKANRFNETSVDKLFYKVSDHNIKMLLEIINGKRGIA